MSLHDWTRVPAGLFHHFHQDWSIEIARTLNRGRLPRGISALVEQRSGPHESDVLSIEGTGRRPLADEGGTATIERPTTRFVRRTTKEIYADRANRIVVKHHLGRIVAIIEIVSPGNKAAERRVRDFVDSTSRFLRRGIHVLVIDPFPPSPRDPFGIHKAIWDEIDEEDFTFPPGKDRILASYETGGVRAAYVEPVAVGDELIDMPLFLANDYHIPVPLESTYMATWDAAQEDFRRAVETGVMPEAEE